MEQHTDKVKMGLSSLLQRWKGKISPKNKLLLPVILGAVGVILLALPSLWEEKEPVQTIPSQDAPAREDYAQMLSQRLEETLGKISGVGEIKVLVTLSQESRTVYATDLEESGQTGADKTDRQSQQNHVILEKGGEEEALVETSLAPKVQGVIIVCRGGADPVVVSKLTEAVSAALNIGPSRIAVSDLE